MINIYRRFFLFFFFLLFILFFHSWSHIFLFFFTEKGIIAVGSTILKVAIAFVFSSVSGIIIGLIMGKLPVFKEFFYPVLVAIESAPPISWIVMAIILLGIGFVTPLVVVISTCIPIIAINTYHGVVEFDKKYSSVFRVYKVSLYDEIFSAFIPFAFSHIISGLKVAFALSWRITITSEFFASNDGIGYYIFWAYSNMELDRVIVYTVFVLFLEFLFLYLIFEPVDRLVKRWKT